MKALKSIRNRIRLPGWLFLAVMAVFDELMLHLWTNQPLALQRLGVVLAFALAFGALLAFVTSLFPAKAGKGIAVGVSVIFAVLYIAEYFIDVTFQNFMPLSMMAAGAEGVAGTFMFLVWDLIVGHVPHILLMLLPIALYALLGGSAGCGRKIRVGLAAAAAALYALSIAVINCIPGYAAGLTTAYDFDSAVHAFGLNVALPAEIYQSHSSASEELSFEFPAATEPAAAETEPSEEPGETEETTAPTEAPVVYGYNVSELDFAALAEEEEKSSIANIHSYVASLAPSKQNEFTGLFEGKNLIFITAEAFTKQVIDPELTPTLYRMATEGICFTDYYQPVWGAGTTGGEFTNLVGLFPNGGECMLEARQQDLFLTIGNQLQDLGYTSAAYHNNDYTYYSRHKTHTLLGYDIYLGYGNGLEEGVTNQWPKSDEEMFRYTIPDFLDCGEPFSLYYMTVSGHSNYYYGSNAMSRKNYDRLEGYGWSESVRCYLAANLEIENSMAYLIEALEEAGIADDTVVVIAPDHYPYGLDYTSLCELYGGNAGSRFVRDSNALIIWSGCLEDMDIVVDEPVYSLDILPTLSNLFGIAYDSRLMPGRDVFSDTDPLVFWMDYSWKTDKGTYDSSSWSFTPNEGVEVSEEYVDRISAQVRNIISYSRAVQQNDYFDYLVDLMGETEVEETQPAETTAD